MSHHETGGRLDGLSGPVQQVAAQVDRLCWTGILLGLAFTMTNVQQFAATMPAWGRCRGGRPGYWTPWCRW
jgi:hypothetical protein